MGAFQNVIISRTDITKLDNALSFCFIFVEQVKQQRGVCYLEVVEGLLYLVGVENVTVGDVANPLDIEYVFYALDIHSQTLQAVRDFNGYRLNVNAAHLLEVGELGDFHTIQPNLPAKAPSAQSRRFPVILYKADIMLLLMNAELSQALQVQLLNVFRRGLYDNLELMMLEQTVRVITVTAVCRAAGRLYVSHTPGLRSEYA